MSQLIDNLFKEFYENEENTATESMCIFFDSVKKQYENNKTLSEKQIKAMQNIVSGNRYFRETVYNGLDLDMYDFCF